MSEPGFNPACNTDSSIISIASSLDFRFGANPPSSPTAVDNAFDFNTDFKW